MTARLENRNLKAGKGERLSNGRCGAMERVLFVEGTEGVGVCGWCAEDSGLRGPFTGIHECDMP